MNIYDYITRYRLDEVYDLSCDVLHGLNIEGYDPEPVVFIPEKLGADGAVYQYCLDVGYRFKIHACEDVTDSYLNSRNEQVVDYVKNVLGVTEIDHTSFYKSNSCYCKVTPHSDFLFNDIKSIYVEYRYFPTGDYIYIFFNIDLMKPIFKSLLVKAAYLYTCSEGYTILNSFKGNTNGVIFIIDRISGEPITMHSYISRVFCKTSSIYFKEFKNSTKIKFDNTDKLLFFLDYDDLKLCTFEVSASESYWLGCVTYDLDISNLYGKLESKFEIIRELSRHPTELGDNELIEICRFLSSDIDYFTRYVEGMDVITFISPSYSLPFMVTVQEGSTVLQTVDVRCGYKIGDVKFFKCTVGGSSNKLKYYILDTGKKAYFLRQAILDEEIDDIKTLNVEILCRDISYAIYDKKRFKCELSDGKYTTKSLQTILVSSVLDRDLEINLYEECYQYSARDTNFMLFNLVEEALIKLKEDPERAFIKTCASCPEIKYPADINREKHIVVPIREDIDIFLNVDNISYSYAQNKANGKYLFDKSLI